jgi:sugar lactone lactonase YvrE
MAWQGNVLWVADLEAQALHKFRLESGRLREERSYPLPGARIAGLAAVGEVLYMANVSANEIQKRRADDSLTLEKSWPIAAQNISALACDDKSLFAAFSKPGRIRQYALDDNLSVVNTFFGPPNPAGMAVAGGALWMADGGSRLLLRYRLDSALSVRDVHAVPGLGPGDISGFALRGRAAWLVQDGRALVLERPLWTLEDRALTDVPAEVPPAPVSPTLAPPVPSAF